jgi:hypothetical protein
MASLISDVQKASLQAVMVNIHDTFKRSLKAFKEGKEVILSTNPSYSHIYKQPLGNVQKTAVERTIEARVYYFPRKVGNETIDVSSSDSLKLQQPIDEVRLKISEADYAFVKDSERFILDGNVFTKASSEHPNGLFGSGFYTVYLKRVS